MYVVRISDCFNGHQVSDLHDASLEIGLSECRYGDFKTYPAHGEDGNFASGASLLILRSKKIYVYGNGMLNSIRT